MAGRHSDRQAGGLKGPLAAVRAHRHARPLAAAPFAGAPLALGQDQSPGFAGIKSKKVVRGDRNSEVAFTVITWINSGFPERKASLVPRLEKAHFFFFLNSDRHLYGKAHSPRTGQAGFSLQLIHSIRTVTIAN